MQGMCLYEWCAAADTIVTARVSLLGEPSAECLQYAAWRPASSSLGLCAHMPWQPRATLVCQPSRCGHSRFWCYGDRHGAHGLMLSVMWPPILITVSGDVIPECNGRSQFNEDTGKPSVPVREFNLLACPLA